MTDIDVDALDPARFAGVLERPSTTDGQTGTIGE